jgi:hypothetical protein
LPYFLFGTAKDSKMELWRNQNQGDQKIEKKLTKILEKVAKTVA